MFLHIFTESAIASLAFSTIHFRMNCYTTFLAHKKAYFNVQNNILK